jgi:hypothetical protein
MKGTTRRPALEALRGCVVKECVVSQTHIAFLLEDGRVCRVGFCVGHVEDEDSSSQTVRNKSDHEHLSATVVARPLTARQRMRETAGMY